MSFDEIRGQGPALRLLAGTLRRDRVGSGYLFHGPEGVGKCTTALAFARAVLCPEGSRIGDACGECPSCVRSAAGSHPGLIEVTRGERKTQIVIDQIHDLARRLSLRPMEGERTVAVIDDAERTGVATPPGAAKVPGSPEIPRETGAVATTSFICRSRLLNARMIPTSRELRATGSSSSRGRPASTCQ